MIRMSGFKKILSSPTAELLQKAKTINQRHRFKVPKDKKHCYEDILFCDRFHCLKIGLHPKKAQKAVLFLYGGMIFSPSRYDLKLAASFGEQSDLNVWFPNYPLCIDYSIDVLYQMIFEVYGKMVKEYGADNISILGFSSGAALSIGLCLYNHLQKNSLPMPRLVIACSPGCVPLSKEEKEKMQALSPKDIMVDAAFMSQMKDIMTHGKDVPTYMLSGVCGDFTGMPVIHFYYGTDEVLYSEADFFEKACKKYDVVCHMHIGIGMFHCYPMFHYFPEGQKAYREIIGLLQQFV